MTLNAEPSAEPGCSAVNPTRSTALTTSTPTAVALKVPAFEAPALDTVANHEMSIGARLPGL